MSTWSCLYLLCVINFLTRAQNVVYYSCGDWMADHAFGNLSDGVYNITSTVNRQSIINNNSLNAYCSFDYDQNYAWTLFESGSRADMANSYIIFSDNTPQGIYDVNTSRFTMYRLSRDWIYTLYYQSDYLYSTCNFSTDMTGQDWLLFDLNNYNNIEFFNYYDPGPTCFNVISANIRGYQCVNSTIPIFKNPNEHIHVNRESGGCECQPWNSLGLSSEDYFGFYEDVDTSFTCTIDLSSTTQWWFGSLVDKYKTAAPTARPTVSPTKIPSIPPTTLPTGVPTSTPTNDPTNDPSNDPTEIPSEMPTLLPTSVEITTGNPTVMPTDGVYTSSAQPSMISSSGSSNSSSSTTMVATGVLTTTIATATSGTTESENNIGDKSEYQGFEMFKDRSTQIWIFICVGVVFVILIVTNCIMFFLCRKERRRKEKVELDIDNVAMVSQDHSHKQLQHEQQEEINGTGNVISLNYNGTTNITQSGDNYNNYSVNANNHGHHHHEKGLSNDSIMPELEGGTDVVTGQNEHQFDNDINVADNEARDLTVAISAAIDENQTQTGKNIMDNYNDEDANVNDRDDESADELFGDYNGADANTPRTRKGTKSGRRRTAGGSTSRKGTKGRENSKSLKNSKIAMENMMKIPSKNANLELVRSSSNDSSHNARKNKPNLEGE